MKVRAGIAVVVAGFVLVGLPMTIPEYPGVFVGGVLIWIVMVDRALKHGEAQAQ